MKTSSVGEILADSFHIIVFQGMFSHKLFVQKNPKVKKNLLRLRNKRWRMNGPRKRLPIVELKPNRPNTGSISRTLTIKNCNWQGKRNLEGGSTSSKKNLPGWHSIDDLAKVTTKVDGQFWRDEKLSSVWRLLRKLWKWSDRASLRNVLEASLISLRW